MPKFSTAMTCFLIYWALMALLFAVIRICRFHHGARKFVKDMLIGMLTAPLLMPTLAIGYTGIWLYRCRLTQSILAVLRYLWKQLWEV